MSRPFNVTKYLSKYSSSSNNATTASSSTTTPSTNNTTNNNSNSNISDAKYNELLAKFNEFTSKTEQKLNQINSCTCDKNKITTLETLITNLQVQFNTLSNNNNQNNNQTNPNIETIRLYPSAYSLTTYGEASLNNDSCIIYQFMISNSDYTDEEIYNALKLTNNTYIKDSQYATYFSVTNKKVNVSKDILNVIELYEGILPLPITVDLPGLEPSEQIPYLLFSFFTGSTSGIQINNIVFEIEHKGYDKLDIKITYPEIVQITTNVPNNYISTKQGKTITITNVVGLDQTSAKYLTGNTTDSDVYKLVAQGETKIYEIIIDWYKTYIPEYN